MDSDAVYFPLYSILLVVITMRNMSLDSVLAWFLTMLIISWIADHFTLIVDKNSVRFAKWVEGKVLSSQA